MESQFKNLYKYHLIEKMDALFEDGQCLLIKTDLTVHCFMASELFTIEYNTRDI